MKSLRFDILKIFYLTGHFLDYALVPRWIYRMRRESILKHLSAEEWQEVERRVAYYSRIDGKQQLEDGVPVCEFKFPFRQKRRFTTYFFDLYDVVKYFEGENRFRFIFGDVTHIPDEPTFVKSRPITVNDRNANAVLLKLNKMRHYGLMVDNDIPFSEKKDMLVARTTWANSSSQRRALYKLYWDHPLCDVGKTRIEQDEDLPQTVKGYLSVRQQLQYKFIACVEGVDVATNLKWVMSSNSIAVSPPMKFETWFMEGTLIADYHYIEVKSDFSDLIEKLRYYIAHPVEAQAIVQHAHEFVSCFKNKRLERATQIVVAQRYFGITNFGHIVKHSL